MDYAVCMLVARGGDPGRPPAPGGHVVPESCTLSLGPARGVHIRVICGGHEGRPDWWSVYVLIEGLDP